MSTTEIAKTTRARSIGPDTAGVRMTPKEFDAIEDYDDCYRYELIDEVLIVNAIPHEAHAEPNELLGGLLCVYKTTHENGHMLDLTLQERYIHLTNSRRQPDHVIWTGLGRQPNPREDVPTIAVGETSTYSTNLLPGFELPLAELLAAADKWENS
jgi:Uma2 family endonuclease